MLVPQKFKRNNHMSWWSRRSSSIICSVVSSSLWPHRLCPPGFSVHGILQARVLEWTAISSSRGSSPPRDWAQCLLGLLDCRWILHCWGEALPFMGYSFTHHIHPLRGDSFIPFYSSEKLSLTRMLFFFNSWLHVKIIGVALKNHIVHLLGWLLLENGK